MVDILVRAAIRRHYLLNATGLLFRRGGKLTPQILIVDDSPILRGSVRYLIESSTNWRVCGEAEDGSVAVRKAIELQPNLIILDFSMPLMNGLDAARQIVKLCPKAILILFTAHDTRQISAEAATIGIHDVVSKSNGAANGLLSSCKRFLGTGDTQS